LFLPPPESLWLFLGCSVPQVGYAQVNGTCDGNVVKT
jgi:hypothetical protein